MKGSKRYHLNRQAKDRGKAHTKALPPKDLASMVEESGTKCKICRDLNPKT